MARDEAYSVLNWVMVAPLTTTLRRNPTCVPLSPSQDGVPRSCVVSLDHIMAIRPELVESFITQLRPGKLQEVNRAIHFALDLPD